MTRSSSFDPREYWEQRLGGSDAMGGVASLDHSASYNAWAYRVRRHVFRRVVRSTGMDPSTARVLDVGSGTGFYLDVWQRLGVRNLTGSDMTVQATGNLRSRYRVPIVQLDITEPTDIGVFDAVSIMDVLFHIVDDAKYSLAFRHLAELLSPAGILFFSEHLPHGYRQATSHRVSRPLDEVLDVARQSGFDGFVRRPLLVNMEFPVDPKRGHGHGLRWRVVQRLAQGERSGYLAGLGLYPFELLGAAVLRESPSTEIVWCRRTT